MEIARIRAVHGCFLARSWTIAWQLSARRTAASRRSRKKKADIRAFPESGKHKEDYAAGLKKVGDKQATGSQKWAAAACLPPITSYYMPFVLPCTHRSSFPKLGASGLSGLSGAQTFHSTISLPVARATGDGSSAKKQHRRIPMHCHDCDDCDTSRYVTVHGDALRCIAVHGEGCADACSIRQDAREDRPKRGWRHRREWTPLEAGRGMWRARDVRAAYV